MRNIKNASIRVLENSDLQCRNAGILSRSNACHVFMPGVGMVTIYGIHVNSQKKLNSKKKNRTANSFPLVQSS